METQDQIIVWDEAALAGLASEWQNKSQKRLIKLLMVARKRRHFWIFNIPKFFKLQEYMIVDRAIALIHVYAKDELELGRFVFFKRKAKEKLFYEWKKSKFRSYGKFKTFFGTFPKTFGILIDEKAYDLKKDNAIMSIDEHKSMNTWKKRLLLLQYKVSQMEDLKKQDIARMLGLQRDRITDWGKINKKYPDIFEE